MCWYSAAEIVHAVERVGAYVMWVRPDTEVDAAAQIAHVMTINLSPTPANEPDERDASTPVVDGTVKVAGAKSSEFALAPPQSAFHTLASVNFGAAADTGILAKVWTYGAATVVSAAPATGHHKPKATRPAGVLSQLTARLLTSCVLTHLALVGVLATLLVDLC